MKATLFLLAVMVSVALAADTKAAASQSDQAQAALQSDQVQAAQSAMEAGAAADRADTWPLLGWLFGYHWPYYYHGRWDDSYGRDPYDRNEWNNGWNRYGDGYYRGGRKMLGVDGGMGGDGSDFWWPWWWRWGHRWGDGWGHGGNGHWEGHQGDWNNDHHGGWNGVHGGDFYGGRKLMDAAEAADTAKDGPWGHGNHGQNDWNRYDHHDYKNGYPWWLPPAEHRKHGFGYPWWWFWGW